MNRTWTEVGAAALDEMGHGPESGRLENGRRLKQSRIARAIPRLEWCPAPKGDDTVKLPASVGFALTAVIKELRLPKVSAYAFSSELAPHDFLGIEANYTNGRARVYVLDRGSDLIPVASDFWPNAKEAS